MTSWVDEPLAELMPRLRKIRHDLHQHPELGFEEVRTQRIVEEFLQEFGYQTRRCAGTGVVADLEREGAPRIALRADLDCLPMQEDTDLPYRSVHDGRAHKCGHDGHTAILLGVAALLSEHRDRIPGSVRLLFQPAEEGVRGGGAKVMVAEGAVSGIEEIYGLHNWPGFPKGEVRVAGGPVMAEVNNFEIAVVGVGGHGAQPQRCRDPIVAAAHLVTAMQTVISRGVGPEGGAVLSFGAIQGGTANNVIPGRVRMCGTVRTFDEELRDRLFERMREVASGTAAAFGVAVDLEIEPEYPVLINDAGCAENVRAAASQVVGDASVTDAELPLTASEDFAFFAKAAPSAYFFLGAGNPVGDTPGCHHPDFDFDDDLLATGARIFVKLCETRAS